VQLYAHVGWPKKKRESFTVVTQREVDVVSDGDRGNVPPQN